MSLFFFNCRYKICQNQFAFFLFFLMVHTKIKSLLRMLFDQNIRVKVKIMYPDTLNMYFFIYLLPQTLLHSTLNEIQFRCSFTQCFFFYCSMPFYQSTKGGKKRSGFLLNNKFPMFFTNPYRMPSQHLENMAWVVLDHFVMLFIVV